MEISQRRTNILKAEKSCAVAFSQEAFPFEVGGCMKFAVEFFPKNDVLPEEIITASNIELFEEHGRLKGTMLIHFHDREKIMKYFHPAANIIKLYFDDKPNSEGFAFFEVHNIDLIELSEPYKIRGLLSSHMKFIMKGFQEADKFIMVTPEMVNWLEMFGVKIWAYTCQQKKIEN